MIQENNSQKRRESQATQQVAMGQPDQIDSRWSDESMQSEVLSTFSLEQLTSIVELTKERGDPVDPLLFRLIEEKRAQIPSSE